MSVLASVLSVCAAVLLLLPRPAVAAGDWEEFKTRFLSPDGRIIDPGQADSSHSEGQGYGLLLAAMHSDRKTFDRVWKWSRDNLAVRRSDALSAWRWGRREGVGGDAWLPLDYNNATDGDLLLALGLLEGGARWGEPAYVEAARPIVVSVRQRLVVERGGRLVLLPGYFGFQSPQGVTVNPSYLIRAAFAAFAKVDEAAFWERLDRDAAACLEAVAAPPSGLIPDWVLAGPDGALRPAPDRPDRHGYEAVRTLLYAVWRDPGRPAPGAAWLLAEYERAGRLAAHYDLSRNPPAPSEQEAPAGFHAVLARAAAEMGRNEAAVRLRARADELLAGEGRDYYSYALCLLAGVSPKAGRP